MRAFLVFLVVAALGCGGPTEVDIDQDFTLAQLNTSVDTAVAATGDMPIVIAPENQLLAHAGHADGPIPHISLQEGVGQRQAALDPTVALDAQGIEAGRAAGPGAAGCLPLDLHRSAW